MAFKTRRIRSRPRFHPLRQVRRVYIWTREHTDGLGPKRRSYLWGGLLIAIAAFIVFKVMAVAYGAIKNFSPESLIFAAGSDLQRDENGYTNLVLLGDGGHVRDGADLIDTIMVVSIDHVKNAVSMLSIPRDYYMRGIGIDDGKINELYRNNKLIMPNGQAFELFREAAAQFTGLSVPYYLRVDFSAFVEAIDALGGIDVDVPVTIDDPYYPNETDDGYSPLLIPKGPQHMDGERALKYVRSRKTTSDFDRAARQQLVLEAVRKKALESGVLSKTGMLKDLYAALRSNINTNMTLREMLSLAGMARKVDQSRLIRKVVHDDPGQDGGFLYTPERQYYNGQFVLVPFGDNPDLIHRYADLIFHKREALWDPPEIEILNATKNAGLAGRAAYQLNRFGFNIGDIENLTDSQGERVFAEKSVIRYYDWKADASGNVTPAYPVFLQALQDFVHTEAVPADPVTRPGGQGGPAVTVVLGSDYNVLLVE